MRDTTQEPETTIKVEDSEDYNDDIDSKDSSLEPRELGNDLDHMNMIEDDKESATAYSSQPQNQSIVLESDLQPLKEGIDEIKRTEGKTTNNANHDEDLEAVKFEDTTEAGVENLTAYGDNIAYFDVPLHEQNQVQIIPMESKGFDTDFVKSTFQFEQESVNMKTRDDDKKATDNYKKARNNYMKTMDDDIKYRYDDIKDDMKEKDENMKASNSDSDIQSEDYIILLEKDDDVIKSVKNFDIQTSDYIVGKEPPKTDHDIFEKISIDLKDSEASNTPTDTQDSKGISGEKNSYRQAPGDLINETNNIEYMNSENLETFGSPLTVFDSFGGDSFANPRFRIPAQFREFLQKPPAWLNTQRW